MPSGAARKGLFVDARIRKALVRRETNKNELLCQLERIAYLVVGFLRLKVPFSCHIGNPAKNQSRRRIETPTDFGPLTSD
jgi:hypothetical protein